MHKTFAAVALAVLPAIPATAQTATPAQPAQSPLSLNFEVASVKPASAQALRGSFEGGPGTDDPGRFTVRNLSLRRILLIAFGIKDNALSGLGWLDQVKFDILARVPAGATRDQLKIMLQNLFMERFRLAVHRTTNDVAGYALVIGKSRVKLKALAESDIPPLPKLDDLPKAGGNRKSALDDDGFSHLSPLYRVGLSRIGDRGRLQAKGATVAEMIPGIQRLWNVPVVDRTGLSGRYSFTLYFAAAPLSAAASTTDPVLPDLASALEHDLGLKLEKIKVPQEMVVVDHVDRAPTNN